LLLPVVLAACGARPEPLPWSDDFSSQGTWQAESDAAAEVVIGDGVLRVEVAIPNQLAWATANKHFEDFHLAVEASQVAGPDDNEYGVLARMRDSENFYRFSISGDGYFLISKFVDGEQQVLGSNWTPSDAVRQGQATNLIEITCVGDRLTLTVNGQTLAQVEDGQFRRGDIGLYAGTFYEGGVEVHFDNLTIQAP
jgi:hypothetical protein